MVFDCGSLRVLLPHCRVWLTHSPPGQLSACLHVFLLDLTLKGDKVKVNYNPLWLTVVASSGARGQGVVRIASVSTPLAYQLAKIRFSYLCFGNTSNYLNTDYHMAAHEND